MTRRFRLGFLFLAVLSVGAVCSALEDDRPSLEQQRALLDRVIANQHRNDEALALYERMELYQIRRHAGDAAPREDKRFRVVPTGTGTLRLPVEENGRAVAGEFYRKQLRRLEQALLNSLNPNAPGYRQDAEKFAKRQKERAETVESARNAFRYTWLGRETRHGRVLAQFAFEPNPAFKATSRATSWLAHVRGTVSVDEEAAQVVRLEGEVFRDILFGGGILGKVYRGSRVVYEQAEVAPGVWLPTRYEYDLTGRKFLFGFELHEITEASEHRRIGPPAEALAAIQRELSQSATSNSSP